MFAANPVQHSYPSDQLNELDHVSAIFGQVTTGLIPQALPSPSSVMPAPSNSVKKARKPKKPKKMNKAPKLSPSDYVHLQKKSTEKKKQFGRSENTNNSYGGQVKQGQEFVARFSMEQAEAEKLWQENREDAMSGDDDEGDSCNIAPAALDPDFHKAFDGTPIQCTPLAISMFMTYKCFTENRKASTAVAIHAAFTSGYNFYHKNKATAYGSLCISPQSL